MHTILDYDFDEYWIKQGIDAAARAKREEVILERDRQRRIEHERIEKEQYAAWLSRIAARCGTDTTAVSAVIDELIADGWTDEPY